MTDSHDPAAPEPVPSEDQGGELPPLSESATPEAGIPESEASDEAEPEDWDEAESEGPHDPTRDPELAFLPVGVRYRYDGWTPDRQVEFIGRLADCGCVEEAARSVGMSRISAYALRRRSDAQAFRLAWDAAMDTAVARLNDAAMARAINGVPVPIFQGGEQVGERRHFDERLTMFLLRYRDPVRYGKWLDRTDARQEPEGPAWILGYRILRMVRAAWAAMDAAWRGEEAPPPRREWVSAPVVDES